METNFSNISFFDYVIRDDFNHASYDPEQEFYTAIKLGDIAKTLEMLEPPLHLKEGMGRLSKNKLQNIKYHFVINAALIARYCIEGGMEMALAFRLSDYYIIKADNVTSIEEISKLNRAMSLDYCTHMKDIRRRETYSRPVIKCIDYIYDNLNKRITLKELSEYAEISEGHLSRLFKKETSQNISEFIMDRKIETAKNLLTSSDYDIAQIAFILAFPSQSYFTEVFKKSTGLTPNRYRSEIRIASPFSDS